MLCALVALAGPLVLRAQSVTNKGLVGVGRIAHDKKDKYGETFGSLSGLALDLQTLTRNSSGSTYSATLYTQPDRGITRSGAATNYRPRRHKFALAFNPDTNGSKNQDQLSLTLSDTTLYAEADGTSLTSLDPSPTTSGTRAGFPKLPQAPVSINGRISLDAEGLALLSDGSFFVCDEYGPYLYRFSADGTLLGAIRPPEALIPKRNSQDSFSSDNPAAGQPSPSPAQPASGRANNKGIEGLSASADGRTLYAFMQAATRQDDGGSSAGQNRFARLLAYNITDPASATLTGEWVLPLPTYTDSSGNTQIAEQHELVALTMTGGTTKFLVLATDGTGRGSNPSNSRYRSVLIFDTSSATNIAGSNYDSPSSPLAQNGILANNITAATSVVLVDLNNASQLDKFGLNNSSSDNSDTLAGKWESLALMPALDSTAPDDFFLFVGNDNDFSTSSGFMDGASFNSSPNIDTMILAYRVTLPGVSYVPIITTQPASRSVNVGQSATLTAAASGSPTPSYQWSKNGVAVSGATAATLSIATTQATDSGSYTVAITNAAGSVTSSAATLTVSNAPAITTQPTSVAVVSGTTAVFSVSATNSPTSYQWRRNGVNVPATTTGANGATLLLSAAIAAQAGTYSVVVTNSSGSVTSNSATLTVAVSGEIIRLMNLSTLTDITDAVPSFRLGTVVNGSGTKALVVRAAGPSLTPYYGAGTIPDPQVDLLAGQTVVATNNDWQTQTYPGAPSATEIRTVMASVGAFPFEATPALDAAVYGAALPARDYTVLVSGMDGSRGVVIAEIYDAAPGSPFTSSTPRLINVSVLKQVNAGGYITLGFIIGPAGGTTAKTILIRAIGPGLIPAPFNIQGTMSDPQLTLFSLPSQTVIATNDNWGGDAALTKATQTVAPSFVIADAASKDAMLLVTLPPGSYSAEVRGVGTSSGLVIVEAYELP